jgi:hypothetical protein
VIFAFALSFLYFTVAKIVHFDAHPVYASAQMCVAAPLRPRVMKGLVVRGGVGEDWGTRYGLIYGSVLHVSLL